MRKFFFIFFLFPLFSYAYSDLETIKKDPKKIIESTAIQTSKDFYVLSLAYYFDQELDQAFQKFLIALEKEQMLPPPMSDSAENSLFEEAMALYLKEGASDPFKTAQKLLEKYLLIAQEHPEYHQLNFLLATAYGNLGMFDLFFENFYKSFCFFKTSFLSYKTQAVLHLRLSQRARTEELRKMEKQAAKLYFEKSLEVCKKDMSIYKALIFLAKEEDNKNAIKENLEKIVSSGEAIPRCDLMNHIKEAVSLSEFDIAEKMIENSKKEYEYSRALIAAQNFLNTYKDHK